jgi:protein O-GlcNAc transferase
MDAADTPSAVRGIEELIRRGDWESAESACRWLLQTAPVQASGWACLGVIVLQASRFVEAADAFGKAVELEPGDGNSWHNRSVALGACGEIAEAERCSRQALALCSRQPDFWLQLGNLLFRQERFAEASEAYRQSLAGNALNPTTWCNLGSAEHVQGRQAQARQAYESSLALNPAQTDTRLKLAQLLEQEWSLCEAEALIRQVLSVEPQRADAWSMLGRVNIYLGNPSEAIDAFGRALAIAPNPASHSRLLQSLQYADGVAPEVLLKAHREWAAAYEGQPAPPPRTRTLCKPDRRLRIGFVAADFGVNPIGFLVLPLLEHLDKMRCEITCYFDRPKGDVLTARFRAASDQWQVTHGMPTPEVVELVRNDAIDVLIDLMGHLGDRLPVFAQRPAPLQATWFGYVGTTGLAAIDFLIADRFHVQPPDERFYTESILRMPHGYACYGPPAYAPPVSGLPALARGRVTFGCFNNPAKYSERILGAWSTILRRVPTATLLLKYGGLHTPAVQQRLLARFGRLGIEPQRIIFQGWSPHVELLERYAEVDLALDTHPYSGGVTTCEALWMGVPVITFPGKTFAGRHATSHLINAGYPQFVAQDVEGYVELAVQWAGRLEELAVIRTNLREQMRRSPLCDGDKFARDFLNLLAEVIGTQRQPLVSPQAAVSTDEPR